MLVTRKPRKGRKRYKILWSEETLRDQLWWLKPQKRIKREVKGEVKAESGVAANVESNSSSSSSSSSSANPASSASAPRSQLEVLVKIEPGTEDEVGKSQ
jgi:hypothetical protein